MFVAHPTANAIINVSRYADIRPCSENETHVDFYKEALPDNERGKPDFTVIFDSKEERDEWFEELNEELVKCTKVKKNL